MSHPSDHDNSGRQPHPSGYHRRPTQQRPLAISHQTSTHHDGHHHTVLHPRHPAHEYVAQGAPNEHFNQHDHASAHSGHPVQYPAQVGPHPDGHRVTPHSSRHPSTMPPPQSPQSHSTFHPSYPEPLLTLSAQSRQSSHPRLPSPLDLQQLGRESPLALQTGQPEAGEKLPRYPTLQEVIRTRLQASPRGTFGEAARAKLKLDAANVNSDTLDHLSAQLRKQLSGMGNEPNLQSALKGVLGGGVDKSKFQVGPEIEFDLSKAVVLGGTAFADTTIQGTYADIYGPAMTYKAGKKNNSKNDDEEKRKRHNIPAIVREKYADLVADMVLASEEYGETWDDVTEYWSDASGTSTANRPYNSGIRFVDQCILAVTNNTTPATQWCNSVTEYESLPPRTVKTAAKRAIEVRSHYRRGLCQALAYLIGAWEICGGYLGAVLIGTKFSRLMMKDAETVYLEIGEPRPYKWNEASWTEGSQMATTTDEKKKPSKAPTVKTFGEPFPLRTNLVPLVTDRKRISLRQFLGELTAGPEQLVHDLVKGWVRDDEEGDEVEVDTQALQTFLDLFNVGVLDIADSPTNRPLTKTPPSTTTTGAVIQNLAQSANQFTIRPRYEKVEIMRNAGPKEFGPYIQALHAEAKVQAGNSRPMEKGKAKRRKIQQPLSSLFSRGRRPPSPDGGAGGEGSGTTSGMGGSLASHQATNSGVGRDAQWRGGAGGTTYTRSTGPMVSDDVAESAMDAPESLMDNTLEPLMDVPQSPMDDDDAHHSDADDLAPDDSVSCAGDSESDTDELVEEALVRLPISIVLVTCDEMEAAIIDRVQPHPAPETLNVGRSSAATALSPDSAHDSVLETPNTPLRLPETQAPNSKNNRDANEDQSIQRTTWS